MKYWRDLKNEFEDKKLILLGEKHGASINPTNIFHFVSRLDINTIAIEIDPKWQKVIDQLRTREADSVLILLNTEPWIIESGVISLKHLSLFKKFLNNKQNRIIAIGVQNKNWNLGDKFTAKYIKKLLGVDSRTLVVMGNLHTRKHAFTIENKNFVPAGFHLKNDSVAIRVRYPSGVIFNFKKITVRDDKAKDLLKESDGGLIKSHSKYFDYDYIVSKKVEPL